MYSLSRFSLREMAECSSALRRIGREATSLRDAAERIVRYLHRHLGDPASGRRDCVLVRCFMTRPYYALDQETQGLAREKLSGMIPAPDTRCFTLIASAGEEPDWNKVENSRRYRAIPLVSTAFVRQFPMFSQLLHQFGISLETVVSPEQDLLVDPRQTTYNVFFVPTAAGSPYVPVQDAFVKKYGVESVLCFGGLLSAKELFAIILFSRTPIDRETANLCRSLALGVRLSLLPFSGQPVGQQRDQRPGPVHVPPHEAGSPTDRRDILMGVTEQLLDVYEDAVRAQAARISQARQDLKERAEALKRAERAMQEQTQIVQSILHSMGDGVVVTDAEGQLIRANPAMEGILGFSPLAAPPITWPSRLGLFLGDGATPYPRSEWPVTRALKGERVDAAEICIRSSSMEPSRWVSVNAQAIKSPDGRPQGAVAVFHDISWLKRAQEALYESEHRFRSLVEGAQDIIFTVSRDGQITSLNPAFETVTLWSRGQWIGEPVSALLHPDDVSFCRDVMTAILDRGTSLTCSMRLSMKTGGHVHGEFVGAPQIENGRIVGVLGVVRDVTERQRIQDALRDSEERLRSIVQSTREAIVLVNAARTIAYWNRGAESTFGYTTQEIMGCPLSTIFTGLNQEVLEQRFAEASALGRETASTIQELTGTRRDGSAFPVEVSLAAWKGKSDLFFTLIIRDITERRQAEETLERLHRHHQLVLDSAGEGIYGTDREGRTTFVNPAAAKMLGWDIDELIGQPMHDLVHHSYPDGTPYPRDACPVLAGCIGGHLVHVDGDVFWRKDGTAFPVEYVSTPIWERDHRVVGVVVVFKDTTERKRAQEQLEDSLKRLRILSRRMEGVREEERIRIARELHDELGVGLTCLKIDLSRLGHVLDDQLAVAERDAVDERIRAMKEQVDATIASVQRIVAELRPGVLDDLGLVAAIEWQSRDFQRRTGITCECMFSHEDLQLEPEQATAVFRICQEALTNVARHAGATRVDIALEERDGVLQLEVRDNGRGVSEEQLTDPQSFGLQGMRERAGLLKGELHIGAQPAGGTRIVLRLPRSLETWSGGQD